MSKLRSVNTHFWSDNYVINLDPVEKLLFLYLLTNEATNMLGIYELNIKRIAFDTGIDKGMVLKIFDRFHDDGKITYMEGYVIMHNFLKHQNLNSNMQTSAVRSFNELPQVIKNQSFVKPIIKALKSLDKTSEPIAEIESEYELELESETERESESFVELLRNIETHEEAFEIWNKYRKKKGKHASLYEKDVLINQEWKDKTPEEVAEAILYTVKNGWVTLQYPDRNMDDFAKATGVETPIYLRNRLG